MNGGCDSMQRRDFLHPRNIVEGAAPVVVPFIEDAAPVADPEAVLLRFARNAMATRFEVVLPMGTPNAHLVGTSALDQIDQLEQQMTVYRPDSEVSLINATAVDEPVVVELALFALFADCERWHRETRGAFDIAVGAIIKAWGFFRREGRVPSVEKRRAALEASGMKHVELDAEAMTIRFARPGLELNLGAVGKGFALDRVVRVLRRQWGVSQGLVHGGHSSVFAIGREPGGSRGWPIGLLHPDDPTRRLGQFRLIDRGLGVSAATHQHFVHEGRKLGHILDPRTAWPADGIAIAAVTAPTAAEADALATAFFILGVNPAREICAKRADIGAALLTRGPKHRLELLGTASREFEVDGSVG